MIQEQGQDRVCTARCFGGKFNDTIVSLRRKQVELCLLEALEPFRTTDSFNDLLVEYWIDEGSKTLCYKVSQRSLLEFIQGRRIHAVLEWSGESESVPARMRGYFARDGKAECSTCASPRAMLARISDGAVFCLACVAAIRASLGCRAFIDSFGFKYVRHSDLDKSYAIWRDQLTCFPEGFMGDICHNPVEWMRLNDGRMFCGAHVDSLSAGRAPIDVGADAQAIAVVAPAIPAPAIRKQRRL